jgi:hypothetical protein
MPEPPAVMGALSIRIDRAVAQVCAGRLAAEIIRLLGESYPRACLAYSTALTIAGGTKFKNTNYQGAMSIPDLVQETIARILSGARNCPKECPAELPFSWFLWGAFQSIASHRYEYLKRMSTDRSGGRGPTNRSRRTRRWAVEGWTPEQFANVLGGELLRGGLRRPFSAEFYFRLHAALLVRASWSGRELAKQLKLSHHHGLQLARALDFVTHKEDMNVG